MGTRENWRSAVFDSAAADQNRLAKAVETREGFATDAQYLIPD